MLSFLTRATTDLDVIWMMKVEVRKNGTAIYTHEINHQLLHFTEETEWFSDNSFVQTFENFLKELLAINPPLPYKYALGRGIDYDSLLHAKSDKWAVKKNGNMIGFGKPEIGEYATLVAEKLDTAVIRTSQKVGADGTLSFSGGQVFFNQYKTMDLSKTMFCRYQLGNSTDTMKALFAIGIQKREQRQTFLGQLLNGTNENNSTQTQFFAREVRGTIAVDTAIWEFLIQHYDLDGTFEKGYLKYGSQEYLISYLQHEGFSREVIIKNAGGEYFASLDFKFDRTSLYLRKDLDENAKKALAALYGILLSVRNKG